MSAGTLRLILGDQLNISHSWFQRVDPRVTYVMMEVRQETDYVLHHIQKLLAVLSAMREFSAQLKNRGHTVIYIALDDPENSHDIARNCRTLVDKHCFSQFEYLLPDEFRVDRQLAELFEVLPVPVFARDTEHFLTTRQELSDFFQGSRAYRMEPYYRHLRKKHSVLLTDDRKPVGGTWNFDKDNRKPFKPSEPVPEPLMFSRNVEDIYRTIKSSGVPSFGSTDISSFPWPAAHDESALLLDHFLTKSLSKFGTYQDAVSRDHPFLYHSRLSFALNFKLLSPQEVINKTIEYWYNAGGEETIAVAQVEGFIRQILGWREYMRGVYWARMPEYAFLNFFEHYAPLPDFYWTGKTHMICLQETVGCSLRNAYAHHIQRLMIGGNFALLLGVDPDAVDQWYLGIYIDAVQWVELPNTRGMSQFADGGLVASKPYVSSAAYINRMSDYCRNCRYDSKKRYGDHACPYNSLYWDFFIRNRKKLKDFPRVSIVYKNIDNMGPDEKARISAQAAQYKKDADVL